MIEQQAVVTRISAGQIRIKSLQSGGCGACAQHASCASATLAKMLPKREFVVESDLVLQAGDEVIVGIDDAHFLSISLLLYGLPVLIMLLVSVLADLFLPKNFADNLLPLLAFGALLLAFAGIHRFQDIFLLHFCFKPQIIRRA